MRISSLHLQAYGHFTDRSLNFGGQPGVHVIYGENEAGKSTTLRAISSVLFGYPHEVTDGFKHDAKDIAVGVELVAKNGDKLAFVRKRRGKNPLTKTDGTPLDEATLAELLGSASKETFEKVFALDHQRLHEHARALLLEGGSLGFSLAAAGSGLSGLKVALDRLKAERGALFLPTGSKPKLNQRIGQLVDLRKEARRRSVSPAEYKKHQKDSEAIESVLVDARAIARAIEAEVRKLERVGRNLPLRAQHIAVVSKLETLADVPFLMGDAAQKRIKAETDRDTAQADLAIAIDALSALDKELGATTLDQAVLDKRTAIDALSARRAVIEDADNSLPRRDAERAQHYKRARDLLDAGELSGSPTELGSLLPSIVKRKQVSLLADRGRALLIQDNTLKNAAAATEEEVRLAQERLSAGEVPADLAALNAALLAADTLGDIRSEIATRTRTLGARAKTSRDNIIGLGLSQGDAAALRQLKVPSEETINRFRQTFAAADAGKTAHAAELARLRQELEDIGERIEKLGRGGAVATKEELDASRATRDATWARVREIFIDESAERQTIVADGAPGEDLAAAFERQEADADQVADAIIAHTKEAAELSLATHQKAETAKKITAAEIAGENLSDGWKALTDEWTGLWPIGSVSILSPIEMADWLKERQVLLREDIDQQAERDVIAGLEAKETQARTSLIAVLKPLAPINDDSPLMAARAQARALVNAAASTASKHAKASEAVESAQQRKRKADLACGRNANEIVEWSVAWKTALREAGLKETLAIDAAVTILDIMTALDGIKLQIDDLSHRIDTMTDSKAAFDAALASLGPLVAGFDGLSGTEICRQLETRLESAKANENTLRRLNEQRGIRTDAQHQASERLNRSNAALKALCAAAGCDDVDALTQIEQASITKQAALQEREGLEKRMLQDGSGLALSALLSECDGFEGDALPGRIALLNEQRGDVAVTIEKALTDRATLKATFDALFGTNQAAETLQDAANVEAEIAILAQEYVDLTLQELALRQSIDLYRDRNQGPILGRAKILFSQLTDGVYSGLRADVDEDDEAVLIAEHATRGSLEISALSDGTVDPLYLALRLAVVQEHNATHEPLPFVADDLLLALDNTRATSTLRALGSFAETGQVLFFTHHEHMVALARAILPTGLLTEHRL